MPLTVDVGLSRKASRNYQSTGVSINLSAELDQSLLGRPARLHQRIARLYAEAEQALEQQARRMQDPAPGPSPADHQPPAPPKEAESRPATPSQQRAINAICRRLGLDPVSAAYETLGIEFETLSVGEASQLIAQLERYQDQGAKGNGRAS